MPVCALITGVGVALCSCADSAPQAESQPQAQPLSQPQSPPQAQPQAQPRAPTFVDVWFGGPIDSIYNAEYERLSQVCGGEPDTCYAGALDTTAVRLAPVWSDARASEPAGWLVSRLRTNGRWPYAALLVQPDQGAEATVMEDLGDWGYGTTLALRGEDNGRFQPWSLAASGYWLPDQGPGFGVVEGPYGLEGRLWRMGPLRATEGDEDAGSPAGAPSAAEVELPAGVYLVLGFTDETVRIRAEVPRDMDCGEPIEGTPDPGSMPVYRVALSELLDGQGRPTVTVAYPKGC